MLSWAHTSSGWSVKDSSLLVLLREVGVVVLYLPVEFKTLIWTGVDDRTY